MLDLLLENQKHVYDKSGIGFIENNDSPFQNSDSLESIFVLDSNSHLRLNFMCYY